MTTFASLNFFDIMQKLLFALLCLILHSTAFGQKTYKFWVEFKDKAQSPYCLCRPTEFLSARALERRARANIALVENDLPVTPAYLEQLKGPGVQLHTVSRWLNAAAIIADSTVLDRIRALPFVQNIRYLGPHLKFRNPLNRPIKSRAPLKSDPAILGDDIPIWGYAGQQNQMLGLPILQLAGHRGAGIWVAVMDGGFTNVDTIPMFDSIALQGRLIPGWDFVERDAGLFEAAQHGTSVLSVMASNLPKYLVGTAPDATYFLLKTEDTGGEFPIEEVNWIAGAEWADSIGIDIINASLGYTSFNDTRLSHTYAELNGKTAIGSRGASIAATKGMIICNSAGNEGDGSWHYIGVPADAPGIITVGAVNATGKRAEFSSFGPTSDGRIKPDLMAPGDQVVVAGNVGISLGLSSGTSLASPMLAGAFAALWSAFPEKTAKEILDGVYGAADQNLAPDNGRGYGLPDMTEAWIHLSEMETGDGGLFSFQRAANELKFVFSSANFKPGDRLELRNVLGQKVEGISWTIYAKEISTLILRGANEIPAGSYTIVLSNKNSFKRLGTAVWP
jgi:hypothetical protein